MNTIAAKIDTRWFQDRLSDVRLSQRKLARQMSLDPAAVSLMIRGKRKMSAAEAAEIARFLGVSVTEVLVRAGIGPTMRETPAPGGSGGDDAPPLGLGVAPSPDVVEIPVVLSDGNTAKLILPLRLAKGDADRIAAIVAAFAV